MEQKYLPEVFETKSCTALSERKCFCTNGNLEYQVPAHVFFMAFEGNTWVNYLIFSAFAAVAFLGNGLVIYVLVERRRTFLNKPYSIFILNLAVVDCITALFLIFSRFLYLPPTPTYSYIAGEVFCRMIWSAWVAFVLGYISIYTCLALTIERWLAVLRPTTYTLVKSKHALFAVTFVWFWGPAVNATTLFRAKYIEERKSCMWTKLAVANKELPWMDFTLQSLIPFTLMVILYSHIYHTMKNLPRLSSNRDVQLKRITVVALLACSALIIGWLPGRITFMMTKFGYLDANGVINITCVMITFLNSCVNPFLYGIYSPAFRTEYKEVFRKTFAFCRSGSKCHFIGDV